MHPFLHLTPNLLVPTYMLILSLTYCIGMGLVFWRAKLQERDMHDALDMALAIMVGGFFGARLLHVVYEAPEIYRENPYEIFRFWQGGFVYYGGLIGAALFAWLYTKVRKISFLDWADFFTPVLSLGYAIGRTACYFNGCCYGKLCELPWAIEFHYPGLPVGLRHPAPIYASLTELFILCFLIILERKKREPGFLFLTWLVLHGCARIVMEAFRDDDRGPALAGLSISTVISILLVIISLLILTIRYKKSKTKTFA